MSPEQQELIADAELGEQARVFLDSELGRCVIGMAMQEVTFAHEQLENVDPTNTEEIRRTQNRIWRARAFEGWLRELVTNGEAAINVYRQQQEK